MQKRFYLFVMTHQGPDLFGPYGKEQYQDEGVVSLILGHPDVGLQSDRPVYWLEVNEQGVPSLGQYSDGFMADARAKAREQKGLP